MHHQLHRADAGRFLKKGVEKETQNWSQRSQDTASDLTAARRLAGCMDRRVLSWTAWRCHVPTVVR